MRLGHCWYKPCHQELSKVAQSGHAEGESKRVGIRSNKKGHFHFVRMFVILKGKMEKMMEDKKES